MSQAIEIKELQHSFGKRTVLNRISFSVEQGEVFGLLGPSGAGKTTLINILTGQLKAAGGESYLLGTASADMTGEDYKQIGIMMDNFGLYERMNCYDNLKLELTALISMMDDLVLKAKTRPASVRFMREFLLI